MPKEAPTPTESGLCPVSSSTKKAGPVQTVSHCLYRLARFREVSFALTLETPTTLYQLPGCESHTRSCPVHVSGTQPFWESKESVGVKCLLRQEFFGPPGGS